MEHILIAGKYGVSRPLDLEGLAQLQILLYLKKQHFSARIGHIDIFSVSCSRGKYKKLMKFSKKNKDQLFILPVNRNGKNVQLILFATGRAILLLKKLRLENVEELSGEKAVRKIGDENLIYV